MAFSRWRAARRRRRRRVINIAREARRRTSAAETEMAAMVPMGRELDWVGARVWEGWWKVNVEEGGRDVGSGVGVVVEGSAVGKGVGVKVDEGLLGMCRERGNAIKYVGTYLVLVVFASGSSMRK